MLGPHATDFDSSAPVPTPAPSAELTSAAEAAFEPPELTGLELSAAGTLELAPLPEPMDLGQVETPADEVTRPAAAEVVTAVEPIAEAPEPTEPTPAEPAPMIAEAPAAPEPPSVTIQAEDDAAGFEESDEDDADREDDDDPIRRRMSDSSIPGLSGRDEADVPDADTPRLPAPSISPLRALEAVLFAAHEPLAPARLGSVVGDLDGRTVRKMVETLNEEYARTDRAFRIEEIAGGFQVLTKPEFNTWLKKLFKSRSEGKLSQTAMLTLAIVAYKQPIKRVDIEGIRGAACGEVLRALMDKGLVKITGREESLGRPLLYGTTKKFLQFFGLASLKELPKAEELAKP